MQNAGQQYCQGGATSHQNQAANFGHTEPSNTNNGGSTTSSLRQFRRKVEDKHHSQDTNQRQIPESHVARVAPQNHYPPRTSDCYRYPSQYQDYSYSVPSQVKYSEISEPPQSIHQEHVSPGSVIQKVKGSKDYMDMCNPQHIVKQPYNDHHMNTQPQSYSDGNVLPQAQYVPKDTQVHPLYKQESQYFPKEPQYPAQLQHQMQKYNMPPTPMRKFPPSENEFLSKLQQINPMVARSIMSDHHLQEPQKTYQNLDQNRMYPIHHNQRYMNHASTMQGNHYPHAGFMPSQPYTNYPSSCTFARSPQMSQPRFSSLSPHERSISPRRSFSDGMTISMNYPGVTQKISPNYPQFNAPDFSQHYHQRRPSISQDYYQQHCRPPQYMPHQIQAQEIPENRVTVSDSIKQYIENWADEETASEMNQTDANRFNKDGLRIRDDQLGETVYTINASELQYLEPLVESENGIPLVTVDNSSGMIRIVDKNAQVDFGDHSGERIVNLQIMDSLTKPDCMLASKPNELNQRLHDSPYNNSDKSRVVIQQNTVIQSRNAQNQNITKEPDQTDNSGQQTIKVGNSLPMITDEQEANKELKETALSASKKEVVDKNCSPINMDEIEALKEDRDFPSNSLQPNDDVPQKSEENELFEFNLGSMSIIEPLAVNEVEGKISENDKDKSEIKENIGLSDIKKEDMSSKITSSPPCKIIQDTSKKIESAAEDTNEDAKTLNGQMKNDDRTKTKETCEKSSDKKEETCDIDYSINQTKATVPNNEKNSKRSRRIFSVDDIINNIGVSVKKPKKETERRHSLHSVMEFLDKELKNTFLLNSKEKETETKLNLVESVSSYKPDIPESNQDESKNIIEVGKNKEDNLNHHLVKEIAKHEIEIIDSKSSENCTNEKTITKKSCSDENSQSSQDIQFRNVIKVEDSNVWLHIAGELVEINVSTVNGKKVISVTPMSSSTLVDFNDNYETLDSNDVPEMLKFNEPEVQNEDAQVLEIESIVPEIDCVEPTSEVIIGMDLTLEEEIKLDVAQPQVLCTKASKKAYDNDLQIPSITTSDDVNNKSDNYTNNDKVSSTKEKNSKDCCEESEELKSKSDREKLREFRKIKPHPKEERKVLIEDEDEFVPFKELIKARKAKKMKMLEMKKTEEIMKADSTNKEDEIVKESSVDIRSDKKKDEKNILSKSLHEDNKKRKSPNDRSKSNNGACEKIKSEKKNRDKHKSAKKIPSVKEKTNGEKNDIQNLSSPTIQDQKVEETPKKESSAIKLSLTLDLETIKTIELKEKKISSESTEITEIKSIVVQETDDIINGVVDDKKVKRKPASGEESMEVVEGTTIDQRKEQKHSDSLEGKKKLSLQEYNRRKRKLMDKNEIQVPVKKSSVEDNSKTLSIARSQRPKSLDDIASLKKTNQSNLSLKRKYSLGSLSVPKNFDWDETQSPKMNFNIQEKHFSEFRGLINENPNPQPVINKVEDKSLQNYKEKVESKLSSLNIQIPKSSKLANTEEGELKKETSELMHKFLQNGKLTATEMEKIKKIITFKRLVQQLDKVKPNVAKKNLEIKNDSPDIDKDLQLILKKPAVITKKKKKRFRNLYSISSSETEDEPIDPKNSSKSGDYSVVQSNCLAGVVPKLIIKRRPEMPIPFVKLERLDLDVLVQEKRVYIE